MELVTTFIYMLVKLILVSILTYLIHIRFKENYKTDFVNFLVIQCSLYACVAFCSAFILVQLQCYSVFNILFILIVFALMHYYRFSNPKHIYKKIANTLRKTFTQWLIWIEQPTKAKFELINNKYTKKNLIINMVALSFITGAILISRSWFYAYDASLFSRYWFSRLTTMYELSHQVWNFSQGVVLGDYLLIHLFGNLMNTSMEFSLQIFGLVENLGLSILLYWLLLQIGNTKKTIALLTSLLFIGMYSILPLNLELITAHKPVFAALLFAIPTMVIVLKAKRMNLLVAIHLTALFVSILLINVFVYLTIVLPFLLICLLTVKKLQQLKISIICIALYCLTFISVYGTYYLNDVGLITFLKSNLIHVNTYSNNEHLLININQLLSICQVSCLVSILLCIVLSALHKNNNRAIIVVLLLCAFLAQLGKVSSIWIDIDFLYHTYAISIPLALGLSLAVVARLFKPLLTNYKPVKQIILPTLCFIVLGYIMYNTNQTITTRLHTTNTTHWSTLNAYTAINNSYLPYSYAVVNKNEFEYLSNEKHYFLSQKEFNKSYLKKDKLYQNIIAKNLLSKHPNLILPNAILVFIYKKDLTQKSTLKSLQVLKQIKQRNRKMRQVYEDDELEVIEVINKEHASKIADLMFNY